MKYPLVLIAVFTLALTACKTKKTATSYPLIRKRLASKVIKQHTNKNFDKKTVDAKLRINYKDSKNSLEFNARIKIKKDEVIWIEGTKFITLFKIKITPDKLSYYSPIYNDFFEGNLSELKKVLGADISFKQLQNLFLGQAITDLESERQSIKIEKNTYLLTPKKQNDMFNVFFYINPNHYKLDRQIVVNTNSNESLDFSYPHYTENFPAKINILLTKKNSENTKAIIRVRSIKFNTKLKIFFSIPHGYKKINL
ncbi:MAG: DUF4292 domain-containing protein [Tenacibaculum sp.]